MKKIFILAALFMLVIAFMSFGSKQATGANTTAYNDSLEKDRAKYIAIVLEKIKGKENLPVDSVFKNIKMFKGIPARRLLAIMNMGYSNSLGVSCGHCHNTDDFASEEKKQKEIARQMAAMNKEINNTLLKNITGLQSDPAVINCTTCHRGQIKPALDLEKK
jgi:hypothetical protein